MKSDKAQQVQTQLQLKHLFKKKKKMIHRDLTYKNYGTFTNSLRHVKLLVEKWINVYKQNKTWGRKKKLQSNEKCWATEIETKEL